MINLSWRVAGWLPRSWPSWCGIPASMGECDACHDHEFRTSVRSPRRPNRLIGLLKERGATDAGLGTARLARGVRRVGHGDRSRGVGRSYDGRQRPAGMERPGMVDAEEASVPTTVTQRAVDQMAWLDPIADAMHKAYDPVLGQNGPRAVRDALYGTWLGHPLHPAVVTAPIGFWMASLALDFTGEERAADLTLKLGLLGAGAAAATGAAQWQDTVNSAHPRRIGILHALLNTGATALYGLSLLQRRRGQRRAGRTLSLAGFAVANLSAWLGGDLSYDLGIGVNRTAFDE